MAGLTLRLFGEFALFDENGAEIRIRLAKERALLAYLALHPGKKLSRAQLADLLWSRQSEQKARHSLSQALSTLARAHQDVSAALERERLHVRLQMGCLDVDALRLLELDENSDSTALTMAVDRFEPGILAEFSFDEPGFDEWATMLREDLHARALRAGAAYLSLDAAVRGGANGLEVARKMLRIDPFYEPAHQALIRDCLHNGDMAGAKRQARFCTGVLRHELGVEPGPETRRLIAQITSSQIDMGNAESKRDEPRTGLPVTPSIVVLAMQNLTGDVSLDHVCQGLSDDITTELIRFRSLFVISRESAFQLSAEPESTTSLCRRLGVRHALCGSLRPHRGKLRINLRLIEGDSGQTVWGENYDAERAELLEVSDDVTENLVARLSVSLEEDALARTRRRQPSDWSAYDHLLQGLVYHHKSWYGTGMLYGAIKHFTRAVELDPELARAHAYLACAISAPWYKQRESGTLDRCMEHARRAVEIDPFEAEAQRIMGGVYLVRSAHDLAKHHFDLALRAHPGNAHVLAHAAKYRTYVGDHLDAVSLVNKARQLNPLHPAWYWQHLGIAMFGLEEYRQAISMFSRLPFLVFFDRLYLAAAHAHLGNDKAAGRHLGIALRDKPELDRKTVARFLPYNNREYLGKVVEGLAKAGLT